MIKNMAKTIDELEQEAQGEADYDLEIEEEDEPDLYAVLANSIDLLRRCNIMFEYASDAVLCKNITNRERNAMLRLSDQIEEFCEEVQETLNDEDEE